MALDTRGDVESEVERRLWYHTIELAPGVETPGWFDLRPIVSEIGFPASLEGRRCLDVGTFDGFWAFEMERRGAREVIGVDLLDPAQFDWPAGSDPEVVQAIGERKGAEGETGSGFEVARRALGSKVERVEGSAYDLDPATFGRFDFVYLGSLLLHLRDPVRALERVRAVCSGELLLCDAIDPFMTLLHPRAPIASLDGVGRPWWWKPNAAGLARMVEAAGFELTAAPRRVRMKPGAGQARPPLRQMARALGSRQGRAAAGIATFGDPHLAIHARPAA